MNRRSRRLTVANVGDSKCILCRNGFAIQIHRTHRVGDHEDEIRRIKKAGGSVVNKRSAL
jgi:serine/threonine protein phosphatase PrpC